MPLKHPRSISLQIAFPSYTPTDGTTWYFGGGMSGPTGTADQKRVYSPVTGRIKAGIISTFSLTTAGSGENIVMVIRLNNTTDYTFATVGLANAQRTFSNLQLNIPITAGDYIEMKVTNPTWATDPAGMRGTGVLIVEYP